MPAFTDMPGGLTKQGPGLVFPDILTDQIVTGLRNERDGWNRNGYALLVGDSDKVFTYDEYGRLVATLGVCS